MSSTTSFHYILKQAEKLKEEGNALFSKHQYDNARRKYKQVLHLLESNNLQGPAEKEKKQLAALIVHTLYNEATCSFNLKHWEEAENLYKEALRRDPNYVKALFKMAMTQYELHNYKEAMQDIKRAFELDKTNTAIRDGYQKIREKYNEEVRKQKGSQFSFYKKKSKNKSSRWSNWYFLALAPVAAVAIYQGVKHWKKP